MSEELPNLSLLIKLLKMTGSSNDMEALAFCRRANAELKKFGGDWETLLRSRITIIGADPFTSIPEPPRRAAAPAPPPRPAPQPYTYNPPPPPLRPRQAPRPTYNSPLPNKFTGSCYCCGISTAAGSGIVEHIARKWEVICKSCSTSSFRPTKRVKPKSADLNFVLDSLEKGIS